MTLSAPDLPTLAADAFVLRALRLSDAGLFAHYAGDARVARMTTHLPHPLPPGAAEALVSRLADGSADQMAWALDATRSSGGEFLGLIALSPLGEGQSDLTYWIAPAYWNTGLASAAVAALMAANPLGDTAWQASVFQDNLPAARVLTNRGFDYTGEAQAFSVARNATAPTWTYNRNLG